MHKNSWTLRVLQGLSKKNFYFGSTFNDTDCVEGWGQGQGIKHHNPNVNPQHNQSIGKKISLKVDAK